MKLVIKCLFTVLGFWLVMHGLAADEKRVVLSLDGMWDVARGATDSKPESFQHRVPVPGLISLAKPPLPKGRTKAFWYRRYFTTPPGKFQQGRLVIGKAFYGVHAFLNGHPVGQRANCVTAARFDVLKQLKPAGEQNELLIRVGGSPEAIPEGVPWGKDIGGGDYPAGIFDRVRLVLSGSPYVVRVQVAPDIKQAQVRVRIWMGAVEDTQQVRAKCIVREKVSGKEVGRIESEMVHVPAGEETVMDLAISIRDMTLWSPDNPFLYTLETALNFDQKMTTFGMRDFGADTDQQQPLLNGRPYYMRGTTVCAYRLFNDPTSGALPWDEQWVRNVFRKFKSLNWNCIRYHISLPPDLWHELSDEMGLLIVEEFPCFPGHSGKNVKKEVVEQYAREDLTSWMQERWNHPSLVMWDAHNEGHGYAEVLNSILHMDMSKRPSQPGEFRESHPYVNYPNGTLADYHHPKLRLQRTREKSLARARKKGRPLPPKDSVVMVDEYCYLWLRRDGSPKRNKRWLMFPPEDMTSLDFRRRVYAYMLAAETEFYRHKGRIACIFQHSGLRGEAAGSISNDCLINLSTLEYAPYFEEYVRDAFAPVSVMVDLWEKSEQTGKQKDIQVSLINDLFQSWSGSLTLRLTLGAQVLWERKKSVELSAADENKGQATATFSLRWPERPGLYYVTAELSDAEGNKVRSRRRVWLGIPPGTPGSFVDTDKSGPALDESEATDKLK